MNFSGWPGLALQPISDRDGPLLLAIFSSTREDELRQTGWPPEQQAVFLRQQFDAQHRWYQTHFVPGNFDLILENGRPIGRLYVYRDPQNINVIDIALLPEHRNRGVGTFLMRQILAEAAPTGQTVTLHVECFNRARSLYGRLGFRPIGEEGVYVEMRWEPVAADTTANPG